MQISGCYMQNACCMLPLLDACMFPVTCRNLGHFLCMLHACSKHVAIHEHACKVHALALYMHWPCTVAIYA